MKRGMTISKTISIASVVLAGFALNACGSKQGPANKETTQTQGTPVAVKTVQVTEQEWPIVFESIGTVRNRVTAQVSSRAMAYIREVQPHTGDRVQAGQRLIVLDARDAEAHERQARAARDEAQSAIGEADQAIQGAQANLDLAQATFRRMDDMHNKRSISNQEFDEASAKLRIARSNLEMAQARRKQIDSKIAQTEESIKAASVQVGDTVLTAPVTGIMTVRNAEPGNLAVPGTPLLTIEQEGSYELEAPVEESSLTKVRVGQSVEVRFDFLDRSVAGHVRELVPSVDAASRSFIVKLTLPAIPELRGGLSGRATFRTGSRKVLTIPAQAIVPHGQMQWAFVADQNIARARIITVGERMKDAVEVLSGLSANEPVISPAQPTLTDGARLEIRP
jgi:multidrug efflux pump subunit AcrA (membrane-fusion protein)